MGVGSTPPFRSGRVNVKYLTHVTKIKTFVSYRYVRDLFQQEFDIAAV